MNESLAFPDVRMENMKLWAHGWWVLLLHVLRALAFPLFIIGWCDGFVWAPWETVSLFLAVLGEEVIDLLVLRNQECSVDDCCRAVVSLSVSACWNLPVANDAQRLYSGIQISRISVLQDLYKRNHLRHVHQSKVFVHLSMKLTTILRWNTTLFYDTF